MSTIEERFWYSCGQNRLSEVKEHLISNPSLSVNFKGVGGNTGLHVACGFNHSEIIRLLLLHPQIDVNACNDLGWTPFMLACDCDCPEAVVQLLRDARVKLDLQGQYDHTALYIVVIRSHEHILKLMAASGRELPLKVEGLEVQSEMDHTPLYMARQAHHTAMATLLTALAKKPEDVKKDLLKELKIPVFPVVWPGRALTSEQFIELVKGNHPVTLDAHTAKALEVPLSPLASEFKDFFSKSITYLSLAHSGLVAVPEKISKFPDLVELDLKNNCLQTLSPALESLKHLKKLDIQLNKLSSLPDWYFSKFSDETCVDLSGNLFTDVPKQLGSFPFLTELNISRNALTVLSPHLEFFAKLTRLHIHNNKLSTLPKWFQKFVNRTTSYNPLIDLSGNQLTSVPHFFTTLSTLTEVDFYQNPLSAESVASFIKHHECIVTVGLGDVPFTPAEVLLVLKAQVDRYLRHAYSLNYLKIVDVQLPSFEGLELVPIDILQQGSQKVATYMCDLCPSNSSNPVYRTKLVVVGFENVGKTSLVDALFPLADFIETQGKAKKTEYWCKLQGSTFTKYNQPEDSEPHKGKRVLIEGGKWTFVPRRPKERNFDSSFLDDISKKILSYRIKVEAPSNSSDKDLDLCFPNRETYDAWAPRLQQACVNKSTHGIDIQVPRINSPLVKLQLDKKKQEGLGEGKFEMSVWDFAGQHDYYNNHHYFLSIRSVFLVLWKIPTGDEGLKGLEFWFKSLAARLSGGSVSAGVYYSVIVVGTYLDAPNVVKTDRWSRSTKAKQLAASSGIKNPIQYYEVSCTSLENVDLLRDSVLRAALSHSYMGERVPKSYYLIRDHLIKIREDRRISGELPVVEIKDLVLTAGYSEDLIKALSDHSRVKRALGLLSLWGDCLYFDSPPELAAIVIVDPKFLAKGILADLFVPDPQNAKMRKDGMVLHEDLVHIWKKFQMGPKAAHDEDPHGDDARGGTRRRPHGNLSAAKDFPTLAATFITILEKLGVCFVLQEDREKSFMNQRTIIPALLPEKPAGHRLFAETWPTDPSITRKKIEVERVLQYNIIPSELVSQLLVHLHSYVQDFLMWRNDVVLSLVEYGTLAWISVDRSKNRFIVAVRGREVKSCLSSLAFIVAKVKDVVGNRFSALQWEEMVRSPHYSGSQVSLEDVKADAALPENERKLVCPDTLLPIRAEALLVKAGLLEEYVPVPATSPWWRRGELDHLVEVVYEHGVVKNEELFERCRKLLTHVKGDPSKLWKVMAVNNPDLHSQFEARRRLQSGQHQDTGEIFKQDSWRTEEDHLLRASYLKFLASKISAFRHEFNDGSENFVVPVIQGTSGDSSVYIAKNGYACVGKTDDGYFGKGIYFTSDLSYASLYSKEVEDHLKVFTLGLAIPGSPFPVTEHPFIATVDPVTLKQSTGPNPKGFLGKPCKSSGYQSHYTVVKSHGKVSAYPTSHADFATDTTRATADELVVFEQGQVLPLFILHYDTTPPELGGLASRTSSMTISRTTTDEQDGNLLKKLLLTQVDTVSSSEPLLDMKLLSTEELILYLIDHDVNLTEKVQQIVRDQEIDGRSLVLMKQEKLEACGIPVGTVAKIYALLYPKKK